MIWEIQAIVSTEQGDSFFCSYGQLSVRAGHGMIRVPKASEGNL